MKIAMDEIRERFEETKDFFLSARDFLAEHPGDATAIESVLSLGISMVKMGAIFHKYGMSKRDVPRSFIDAILVSGNMSALERFCNGERIWVSEVFKGNTTPAYWTKSGLWREASE